MKMETKNSSIMENPVVDDSLRQEYENQKALFDLQPPIVQRFLEVQGRQLAEAFTERNQRVRFLLPDKIVPAQNAAPLTVVDAVRNQVVGKLGDRFARRDVHVTLRQKLTELESNSDQAVSISAKLIRFSAAEYIIRHMLPTGRSVHYTAIEGEEIPSQPVVGSEPESAIMAETDAVTEESSNEEGRGSLQVPYVSAARQFYLPQWVAFDQTGKLLVHSMDEAQAHLESMQKFLTLLFAARSLAPYMVMDEEFGQKRYGMLGQLVNQGRAFARHLTETIIMTIKERAAAQSLNRGLGLRLPYFDDQALEIKHHDFVVIPAGRIMFVPAFVVRAAQEERAKVAQDTRLSLSTRKYLLIELSMLESAFTSQ